MNGEYQHRLQLVALAGWTHSKSGPMLVGIVPWLLAPVCVGGLYEIMQMQTMLKFESFSALHMPHVMMPLD